MHFRTSQHKTLSIHLFNVIAVVDRVIPISVEKTTVPFHDIEIEKFIPSMEEQFTLMNELVFIFATSVIQNIPQMKEEFTKIYPTHLMHKYSEQAGVKTKQVYMY